MLFGNKRSASIYVAYSNKRDEDLHDIVYQFRTTESFGVKVAPLRLPPEEVRARAIFKATTKLLSNGHYESGLFWKSDDVKLPNNYQDALRVLHRTESRYVRDPQLGVKAHAEMQALVKN